MRKTDMSYRLVGDEGKKVRGITLILDLEEFYLPRKQVRHLIEMLEKAELSIEWDDFTENTSVPLDVVQGTVKRTEEIGK